MARLAAVVLGVLAGPAVAAPPRLVCSLDRPVVAPHQPVAVQVFALPPAASYRWSATAGRFTAAGGMTTGARVRWDSAGAAPGTYRLTARAATGSSCTLDALVAAPSRSAGPDMVGSEAQRGLLVSGSDEGGPYGLYSYILLGARPDDSNRARYAAVLQAYLSLDDLSLPRYFPTSQLNATFVPVDKPPPAAPDVPWLLDHYDYARARFLLAALPQRGAAGPLIISALHPLGGEGPGAYIAQDLSTVPVSVVPFWMQQFRSQTTQQRVWQKRAIGTVALNLRTAIAVAAEGLPTVVQAVDRWVTFGAAP